MSDNVEQWEERKNAIALKLLTMIAEARARVGATRIELEGPTHARLPRSGMSVDLGGVAKGYALDRMLRRLRKAGVEAALLTFGRSSVWAVGAPPDAPGWPKNMGFSGYTVGHVTIGDLDHDGTEELILLTENNQLPHQGPATVVLVAHAAQRAALRRHAVAGEFDEQHLLLLTVMTAIGELLEELGMAGHDLALHRGVALDDGL